MPLPHIPTTPSRPRARSRCQSSPRPVSLTARQKRQKQIALLCHLAGLTESLLRRMDWAALSAAERQKVATHLRPLASALHLARLITDNANDRQRLIPKASLPVSIRR